MKNLLKIFVLALVMTVSFTSCRNNKNKKEINGVEMDKDADVKVSDDGQKIKMEDDDKKVKIKKDEEGNVEKKKIKDKDDN